MGQNRDQRDMGRDRNESETGEPIQLNDEKRDEKQKDQRTGQQGGQHQGGGQHQQGGQQPNRPAQARPEDKQRKPA